MSNESTAFQRAAEAAVDGELTVLQALLDANPALATTRSRDSFSATLLHFVAANGVPDELQRSPANAVEVARLLLDAGADPNATSESYGGGPNQTPLCLLVSSWHPHERGVQASLVHALVRGGALVDGTLADGAPLAVALLFGYTKAAEALRDAGARVDNLFFAAGLGDSERVKACFDPTGTLLPDALGTYVPQVSKEPGSDSHALVQEALMFAVSHGRVEVAELLLSFGADVNGRTSGHHAELPLLQAVFVGEPSTAGWLFERGADPDLVCGKRHSSTRQYVEAHGPEALGLLFATRN